jgi:6-phosphogluconate dehydrogenase
MQVGMVGLGRMGGNMVRRLMESGHACVVFDQDRNAVERLARDGATGTRTLEELVGALSARRVAWSMVPAGEATEKVVAALGALLRPGDILVDGGNSHYQDAIRRAAALRPHGIEHVDVGTSGGVWGLERGYCLMVGGQSDAVRYLRPILAALAPGRGAIPPASGQDRAEGTAEQGYLHCGPAGAGHFVKMIHNGIEYGLMQAYAEGLDILHGAGSAALPENRRYHFNVAHIAELWRRGSVIGSWLLDLTAAALAEDPDLSRYTGFVEDSGEGRWAVQVAVEQAVPADVLTAALYRRFRSRQTHTFAEKVLSAMRHGFGGHVERPTGG